MAAAVLLRRRSFAACGSSSGVVGVVVQGGHALDYSRRCFRYCMPSPRPGFLLTPKPATYRRRDIAQYRQEYSARRYTARSLPLNAGAVEDTPVAVGWRHFPMSSQINSEKCRRVRDAEGRYIAPAAARRETR